MSGPDTHDVNSLAGATYFVVGRGTEGGTSSYHLSVAGITSGTSDPNWGKADKIVANSGYSLGTIQVDLGQRGTWALGATDGAALKPGETSYVDGIIGQAAQYAKDHDLEFTTDTAQLRTDLLSHGNGERGRTTLNFIDVETRDSINAWASSADGQQWIHTNIDYPQIRNATQSAMDMLDKYGTNIPEDRRLQTVAILAKTANQIPSQMAKFERVLKDGGDYDDVFAQANEIKGKYAYYDGPRAASIAERYEKAYDDPRKAAAFDRANTKVSDANFDPSKSVNDSDFSEALKAIGQGGRSHAAVPLREGSDGSNVISLQTELAELGYTDARGHALSPDGDFGPNTKAAVVAFQRTHGMKPDGIVGPRTTEALHNARTPDQVNLDDRSHSGNTMYTQALEHVTALDAQFGRTPDQLSIQFAGSLATAAHLRGMTRIDEVALSEDGSLAFAIQNHVGLPVTRIAEVDVTQAVARSLQQSSAEFQRISEQQNLQQVDKQQTSMPLQAPQQAESRSMLR